RSVQRDLQAIEWWREVFAPRGAEPGNLEAPPARLRRPSETKDLVGDVLAALNGPHDVVGHGSQSRRGAALNRFDIGLDAHQDVVKLVGNRRGDVAEAAD